MKEVIIDCAQITDEAQLHQALFEALSLPEWYGHNLDALFDCLTELWEETHLILQNWDPDATHSDGFQSVFADAAAENEVFSYTLA